MKLSWRAELPQWVLIAGMFLMAAITWPSAPAQIPVHWNAAGVIDRYGGKFEGLLLLPFITSGLYLFMLLLPRIDPGQKNYALFPEAYATIRVAILAVLAAVYGVTHLVMRGLAVDMATVMPLAVGGMLIVIGNMMGKIRPNWFVGVRTPWTLSSKESWIKTHRFGGWLFILCGFGLMGVALLHTVWAFAAMFVLLVGSSIAMYVYSYYAWRDDPDKIPPAGTLPAA